MATVTRRLAALLGASGAGLTDSATSSQITTTSLKDDAVTSAKIGTDQVHYAIVHKAEEEGKNDFEAGRNALTKWNHQFTPMHALS